jgi:putative PIN family toxin of toxin-antitoxin system
VKIVLDTNVLVSGLLRAQGNPAQVLGLFLSGTIQICHNQQIPGEYREVLARPRFRFDPQRIKDVLQKIESDGLQINSSHQGVLGLPDPDDEPFLAVALAASADFLVTGNLAHYPEDKRRGSRVLPPADFMKYWKTPSHGQ